MATEYESQARRLDARHHAAVQDPDARPLLTRLRGYPPPIGLVVGAFAECSPTIHGLHRDGLGGCCCGGLARGGG
eukprot:2102022-Prymnesium_polylepis.1